MPYLKKAIGIYERPVINGCVGLKVGEAIVGSEVRVLDCAVPITSTDNRIPGGNDPKLYQSHERLEWLRANALDLVQVNDSTTKKAIGFALVCRHNLSAVPLPQVVE